uniref:Uncharacterized LOC111838974 n=1 Tax=Paramormyrops kingsleyae TaxID=1676925 RepID=A0A3B3RXZ5_9TELE|nr:uncharacterized protein LOC111838974 [Paramormyrops kingsleyae]
MIRLCVILAHFSKLYLALSNTVVQPSPLLTVEAGDNVTLECSFPKDEAHSVFWFKLIISQRPLLIASTFKFASEATFHNNFKPTRYKVKIYEEINHFIILKTEPSDSGMYYCGTRRDYLILFGAGTFLTIKGSRKQHRYSKVEQYPVSDPVQPGDSVTLQCTTESENCAGEHSVYWFRHGSGESLPGVIYSHGNRSDECEKSPEAGSPTRSCVYSLPKRNLSLSDAGTYYCAVAMCGEMLFGNGTKVHIEGSLSASPVIIGLGTALLLCVTIMVILVSTRNKTTCCKHCAARVSEEDNLNSPKTKERNKQEHDAEMLNYTALHFNEEKSKTQRMKREQSLYSDVRLTE